MRIGISRGWFAGTILTSVVVLVGCSSGGQSTNSSAATAGGPIPVVTSTNVWGDIVSQIGGEQVSVTALISDPAADPHSFEPNAQAQLALSKAALVVENGGGYDAYMQTLERAAKVSGPVINAVEVSGVEVSGAGELGAGELNEHVWYDLPTAAAVATRIAAELGTIHPEQVAFFQANLKVFTDQIAGLTARTAEIKAAHDGAPVAITEPVPLYLTEAAGLINQTPDAFSSAIEEGTDVPPTVMSDTLALFAGEKVLALVYNEQTSSPETEQVLEAARDNAIAEVGVTETLPEGKNYLSWMDANITALAGALGGRAGS